MSSFLCFICHSTVNSENNEETREKYREVVGMNLCPDSRLCYICCHVLNKLWLFRFVCLKRSLEYPVLFSEKGTINLQRNDLEVHTICNEESCHHYRNRYSKCYNINFEIDQEGDSQENYNVNDDLWQEVENRGYNDYREKEFKSCRYEQYGNQLQNVNEDMPLEKNATVYSDSGDFDNNSFENTDSQDNIQMESAADTDIQENLLLNSEVYDVNADNNLQNKIDEAMPLPVKDVLDNYINKNIEELTVQIKEVTHTEVQNIVENNVQSESQENLIQDIESDNTNQNKRKKTKKKGLKKIVLTLEQQKAELEKRRKEKKYIEAEFKCYNCALGFLFKDTYQAHMMRHEESNGEHLCPLCSLRFASAAVLRKHKKSHAQRYECMRCHMVVRVSGKSSHIAKCKKVEPRACHLCGGIYKDANGLQQHLRRYHGNRTSKRSYSCNTCGSSFNNQAAVRTHMLKHVNCKFQCDQCQSTYSSPYTLNQHKKKHAVVSEEKRFHCQTCDIRFAKRKYLLAHYRNALIHRETVLECPICGRSCPTQRSLASHIHTVHSTSRDYVCAVCPSAYTTKQALQAHVKTHRPQQNVKISLCHLCGNSYKGHNKLSRHLREVCEKAKLEEEFATLYEREEGIM